MCRKCFSGLEAAEDVGQWRVINDPGAWGASEPSVLVLGFSKGFTQASAALDRDFEAVPFKGMRPRLTLALRRIGLLGQHESVDDKLLCSEKKFAFGSLVRCSLSRMNSKTGVRSCTGDIMPKAFVEPVKDTVKRCVETYLSNLPASLKLVTMLGTGNAYIAGCRNVIHSIYGSAFQVVNEVAYSTPGVTWVHVAHPSGMNGHFDNWLNGEESTASGRKLKLALDALSKSTTMLVAA
jgi:hypothetical protein